MDTPEQPETQSGKVRFDVVWGGRSFDFCNR